MKFSNTQEVLKKILVWSIAMSWYIYMCPLVWDSHIPMIAPPASERARWPQRTTVSPGQRHRPPTADTRHCVRCWRAEGPRLRAPNTQPRTGTPPPPGNTQTKETAGEVTLFALTNTCDSQEVKGSKLSSAKTVGGEGSESRARIRREQKIANSKC